MSRLFLFILLSACLEAKRPVVADLRLPSMPYISGDSFRAMADHVFDETDRSLQGAEIAYGDIVFVKTDLLGKFFKKVHPYITLPYILVSHNADHGSPAEFEPYLEDEKIIRWYGQNPTLRHHEKFEAIPIGIANRYVGPKRLNNFLIFDRRGKSELRARELLLGINFHPGSNKDARKDLYDRFMGEVFCRNILAQEHAEYLKKMVRAKFILSPEGNGLDCHRTWEAVITGTIPVLLTSELDELLQDLPVVIVRDWQEVTQKFLEQTYRAMRDRWQEYSTEKVTHDYWVRKIKECQEKIQNESKKSVVGRD